MKNYKEKKIWAVMDVDDCAKDKAKELAKGMKKKLGPWLTELIMREKNGPYSPYASNDINLSNHIQQLKSSQESMKLQLQELSKQLANLDLQMHPLPKKSFFDKILG